MIEVGFVFWGLFAVFGAIVAGYVWWMVLTERRDRGRAADSREEGERP